MRVTLTLDIDLSERPFVRPVRATSLDALSNDARVALRQWFANAAPGDYLNLDGTILPALPPIDERGQIIDHLRTLDRDVAEMKAAGPGEIVTLLKSIDANLARLTSGGR